MSDLDRPGVDRGIVAAFERAQHERVRYHLRQAAQYQVITARSFDEPWITQDDRDRPVLRGKGAGQWLRMSPDGVLDREECR